MSISAAYSATSTSSTYSTDPQVQRLNAQIKDWSNCPTTPAPQKRQIVAKLQAELDGTIAEIKHTNDVKAAASGAGSTGLDIRV